MIKTAEIKSAVYNWIKNYMREQQPAIPQITVTNHGGAYLAHKFDGTKIPAAGSDAAAVINAAIAALTPSRTWVETVYCKGDFTLSSYVTPKSYAKLLVDGKWTLANSSNSQLIYGLITDPALSYFTLEGGIYDGNGSNQASQTLGTVVVQANGLDNIYVRNISVVNSKGHGIVMRNDNWSAAPQYYKEIAYCRVYNTGIGQAEGFGQGIYTDYSPGTHVHHNYVETVQTNAGIELGNKDYKFCYLNRLTNCAIGAAFSNYTYICDNWLQGGQISNDGNTADGLVVCNNRIIERSFVTAFGAIAITGKNAIIKDNWITTYGEGINNKYNASDNSNWIIEGNYIESLATGATSPVSSGIRCNRGGNSIKNNIVIGKFTYGIKITYDNDIVSGNWVDSQSLTANIYCTPFSESSHNIANGIIKDNQLMAAAGSQITGTITSMKISGNYGFVTENSGTGSIASGATSSGNVAHGLGYTPTAAEFTINFTENPTNTAGTIWLSGIDGTNFVVNCENDPGASNLDFSWSVRRI